MHLRRHSSLRVVVSATLLALVTTAALSSPPASAKTDPIVDVFVKGFISGFEKSTGVKVPDAEARCIGQRFLAKVSVDELSKVGTTGVLTATQKTVLVQAMGACVGPGTYKAVLVRKLGRDFSAKQKACIADTSLTKLGVPNLLKLDFAAFTGVPATAIQKQVTSIVRSCVR